LPTKHGDPIAQAVPGISAPRWQEGLTKMQGDEAALNRPRVGPMSTEATDGDGVWGFDDTGFPQPGSTSVGVARQ